MRGITLVKIAHGAFGALGAFHIFFGWMLNVRFGWTAPSTPNPATGETYAWDVSDDDDWGQRIVYITEADHAKWLAFMTVGAVFLAVCGALTLYLMRTARREGRTSIY
jgi:hypothetical protein